MTTQENVYHNGVALSVGSTGMRGFIALKDVPPDAAVMVVYSTDNWATSSRVQAALSDNFIRCGNKTRYAANPGIDETFHYEFRIDRIGSFAQYFIVVDSCEGTIIDDNQGRDYIFPAN
jgi:hypothetical protein